MDMDHIRPPVAEMSHTEPDTRNYKAQHIQQARPVQCPPGSRDAEYTPPVLVLLCRQAFKMRRDHVDIMPKTGKAMADLARDHAAASANRRIFINQHQYAHSTRLLFSETNRPPYRIGRLTLR